MRDQTIPQPGCAMNKEPISPELTEVEECLISPEASPEREKIRPPVEADIVGLVELLTKKEYNREFRKVQSQHSRRERQLLKEMSTFRNRVTNLETENKDIVRSKRHVLVLHLLALLSAGIGSCLVALSIESIIGWVFIALAIVVYAVSTRRKAFFMK